MSNKNYTNSKEEFLRIRTSSQYITPITTVTADILMITMFPAVVDTTTI